MTEPDQPVESAPSEEAAKKPSPKAPSAADLRRAASLRERLVREEQDEITVTFDSYGELRKSVDAALKAVDKAMAQFAAVGQKCGSPVGRRYALDRRLFLRPVFSVLRVTHFQLRKAVAQMDAASRTRNDVLDAASESDVAR